jgi:hypothetical protein
MCNGCVCKCWLSSVTTHSKVYGQYRSHSWHRCDGGIPSMDIIWSALCSEDYVENNFVIILMICNWILNGQMHDCLWNWIHIEETMDEYEIFSWVHGNLWGYND